MNIARDILAHISANKGRPDITIVGTGAVGSALAQALYQAGYPIQAIVSRHAERAEQLANAVGSSTAVTIEDSWSANAAVTFICVPDDVIAQTAKQLANNRSWEGKIVAHTSGIKPASALQPLSPKGAYLMSFHPMQTFSRHAGNSFENIYIGLEGNEKAISIGLGIAKDLGSIGWVLQTDHKARYHLAASIASNYLTTVVSTACDVLETIGLTRNEAIALLRPLVTQTCTNVTDTLPEQALTGPAARGDIHTLNGHLEAIKGHLPHLDTFYRLLLAETLNVAVKGDQLTPEKVAAIKRNLQ